MSILHIVNKSPFERNSLASCLGHALDGSSVLLFEDGVYGAIKGTSFSDTLGAAMASRSVYVLGPDLAARGIDESKLVDGVKVVDYAGFVDLSAESDKVQSWL
ncbi:MAG: sulfurtransferase complex subunit TusB [Chromatiales bacterium]|nr:sulfurtransferase complex subunit TusB [Chromatiales bacterium]